MTEEKNHNGILGRRGEEIAAALLLEKGHIILERNWRASHRELDIISAEGKDLHFIEVKTRREPVEGAPWEAVNAAKQKNMYAAALRYLNSARCRTLPFKVEESHFDIVSILFDSSGKKYSLEFIPDAFIPGCL